MPLCRCIKIGDLAGFDVALAAGEGEFVKRRIYLTLERGRDIALRNVFRKVYIAGGFEEQKNGGPEVRRSRIPVAEFAAALHIGTKSQSKHIDTDEVECLLANMIYKVSSSCLRNRRSRHIGNQCIDLKLTIDLHAAMMTDFYHFRIL